MSDTTRRTTERQITHWPGDDCPGGHRPADGRAQAQMGKSCGAENPHNEFLTCFFWPDHDGGHSFEQSARHQPIASEES